jgi:hypothetical protein
MPGRGEHLTNGTVTDLDDGVPYKAPLTPAELRFERACEWSMHGKSLQVVMSWRKR